MDTVQRVESWLGEVMDRADDVLLWELEGIVDPEGAQSPFPEIQDNMKDAVMVAVEFRFQVAMANGQTERYEPMAQELIEQARNKEGF